MIVTTELDNKPLYPNGIPPVSAPIADALRKVCRTGEPLRAYRLFYDLVCAAGFPAIGADHLHHVIDACYAGFLMDTLKRDPIMPVQTETFLRESIEAVREQIHDLIDPATGDLRDQYKEIVRAAAPAGAQAQIPPKFRRSQFNFVSSVLDRAHSLATMADASAVFGQLDLAHTSHPIPHHVNPIDSWNTAVEYLSDLSKVQGPAVPQYLVASSPARRGKTAEADYVYQTITTLKNLINLKFIFGSHVVLIRGQAAPEFWDQIYTTSLDQVSEDSQDLTLIYIVRPNSSNWNSRAFNAAALHGLLGSVSLGYLSKVEMFTQFAPSKRATPETPALDGVYATKNPADLAKLAQNYYGSCHWCDDDGSGKSINLVTDIEHGPNGAQPGETSRENTPSPYGPAFSHDFIWSVLTTEKSTERFQLYKGLESLNLAGDLPRFLTALPFDTKYLHSFSALEDPEPGSGAHVRTHRYNPDDSDGESHRPRRPGDAAPGSGTKTS